MDKSRYHKILTGYFNDKPFYMDERVNQVFNSRKLMELPWQLISIEDWLLLSELLINTDFMSGLQNIKTNEYQLITLKFLNHTGTSADRLYQSFISYPENFTIQILKLVYIMLMISGSIHESEVLARQMVALARKSEKAEEIIQSGLLAISSMKFRGNYDYCEILTPIKELCVKVGDNANLARCLAHYADHYKYHLNDLWTAIKWLQEEESILRKTRNIESLITCINNQAVTYGRLGEPQKQLILRKEVEKITHESGLQDLIALSDSNFGMFYINTGRIQHINSENLNKGNYFYLNFGDALTNMTKGWSYLKKAESTYRKLGIPHSLAAILRRQAIVIHELIQCPLSETSEEIRQVIATVGIPKAVEAYHLYQKYGEYRQKEVNYIKKLHDSMSDWIDKIQADPTIQIAVSFLGMFEVDEKSEKEMKISLGFAKFILSQK